MMFSTIDWIFFDMGHTLIDEDGAHLYRFECVIESYPKLTEDGVSAEQLYTLAVDSAPEYRQSPSLAALRKLGITTLPKYDRALEHPYPDAQHTLSKLHERYRIGIIANQPGGTVKRLRNYGLLDYIDLVYSSTEMGMAKPSLHIFRSALTAAGCKSERALMVGDRLDNDIVPAKSIGMKTVRIRKGFFQKEEPKTQSLAPDADIYSLSELIALLF